MSTIDLTTVDVADFLEEMQILHGSLFRASDATEVNARKYRVQQGLPHATVDSVAHDSTGVEVTISDCLTHEDMRALMRMNIVWDGVTYEMSTVSSTSIEEPSWGGGDSTYYSRITVSFSRHRWTP